MQIVYVAGGAGFIGSHLCKKLLQDGYQVICIDNFLTSSKKNIEDLFENSAFQFVQADITQVLPADLPKPDFIFHLASPASPNNKSPRSYISYPVETLLANSLGTYLLLELAKKSNARFLFASTSEIYGDPEISPQPESYWGNVNPVGVRSVYDEGKRFGEAMTMAYLRKYDVDTRLVRIFNTYGPKMEVDDGRVVSNFIVQALQREPLTVFGDGSQTRSFCYVSDLVEGLATFMFEDSLKGEIINLGNPSEYTILEFAKKIKEITGTSSEIEFKELPEDDPKQRRPDITKAKKLLHWEAKVGLEEGLQKTIQYFKNS
ncbi:MAG TPA: UDP-glucuronic acid decarboxylase family protein [Patescibacteria group bacterium]|nr:UDP-glucuronic acid decarboxylase family protein [Patescibacteria group bacterium]